MAALNYQMQYGEDYSLLQELPQRFMRIMRKQLHGPDTQNNCKSKRLLKDSLFISLFMRQITLFASLLFISLLGAYFYRPFIYSNSCFDFYIADTFPNLMSVPVIISFVLVFQKKNRLNRNTFFSVITGVISYEFLQLFTDGFDIKDIIATLLGAFVSAYFLRDTLKKKDN